MLTSNYSYHICKDTTESKTLEEKLFINIQLFLYLTERIGKWYDIKNRDNHNYFVKNFFKYIEMLSLSLSIYGCQQIIATLWKKGFQITFKLT